MLKTMVQSGMTFFAQAGSALLLFGALATMSACQGYTFEERPPLRAEGKKISEVVTLVNPTDILFVVDNSGSMIDELIELQNNIGLFVDELLKSDVDFQIGVITPDVECNVPDRFCGPGGRTSLACCNRNLPMCQEFDENGDGVLDRSTCDGGRLRGADGGRKRIFTRPSADERDAWLADFNSTISSLGCEGSGFEAPFEAAREAIACAVGDETCRDVRVAALNQGFVRDNADLVVLFFSDEDDCSFRDVSVYDRPVNGQDQFQQFTRLCSPEECYAFVGQNIDTNSSGLWDWTESHFRCGDTEGGSTFARTVNPPLPTPPSEFVNEIIALKGGNAARVRAAAVIAGVNDSSAQFGIRPAACLTSGGGASSACGCWSTTPNNFYCDLTESIGQLGTRIPSATSTQQCGSETLFLVGGCTGMPGSRMMEFVGEVAARRVAAGTRPDALVDTICQSKYDQTLFRVVNNVILSNCFGLGEVPESVGDLVVRLNGATLPRVEAGAFEEGWSWQPGSAEICLEGGLRKALNDRFEIFVLSSQAG